MIGTPVFFFCYVILYALYYLVLCKALFGTVAVEGVVLGLVVVRKVVVLGDSKDSVPNNIRSKLKIS